MKYEEIIERQKEIVSRPVRPIPEDKLQNILEEYHRKHRRSAELFEQAKRVIPGGVEHNLSFNHPFPLTMKSAQGYTMTDVDGNEFIDYLMAGGPIILGHHFAPLDDLVIEGIKENGPGTGLSSEIEILAAGEIVKHMPGVDVVRFLQSGTEADMAAIRIARAFTGKTKIIKIGGSYHGWSDQVVYSMHVPGTGPLQAAGIPAGSFNDLVDVAPNDFDMLEKAFIDCQDQGGAAGVLIEPVGGECGTHPVHPDWNQRVRELCDAHEALLIFDEVVTGFRLDMGGAQKYFGVTPDLTVLGKIIGHGYPSAGAVGGRREVMDICHAGLGKKPYLGGTLAANPITMTACYHGIRLIEEHDAIAQATAFADELTRRLNELFDAREDLPFFAYNFGPIIQYQTAAAMSVGLDAPNALEQIMHRMDVAQGYQAAAVCAGLYTLAGSRMYTCMQHDNEALEGTLSAWERILALIPKD